jgi:hypothetical protein
MLAACVFAAAARPAAADAQPFRTGISGLSEDAPLAFQRVRETGAEFVRIAVDWSSVAPRNPPSSWQPEDPADPHYVWQRPDEDVTAAAAAGLVAVVMIEEAPLWAQRCRVSSGSNCDPDPQALAAFATAAARRYSGQFGGLPHVQYWQGLNEPNLSIYFNPQFEGDRAVSPILYRTLANSFYSAVKAVDPANVVIAAGLGPIAVPGYTIGPMRFTRELLCMRGRDRFRASGGNCGGGVHFDIFDIHPYTTGGPTHTGGSNDVELGDLAKLRALLNAADRAGRIKGMFQHTPLWIGEISWDSNPPDPGGLPMKIETRWAAEALYRAWTAGVQAFFWFSLRDRAPQPSLPFSQTLQSGLYFRGPTLEQDQPKEVLYAFRFPFVSFPRKRGLSFWGRTPNSSTGKVVIQVWKGRHWRSALVKRATEEGIFSGLIPNGYGSNKQGLVRAVYQGQASVPFSMRPVPDFPQPPFG